MVMRNYGQDVPRQGGQSSFHRKVTHLQIPKGRVEVRKWVKPIAERKVPLRREKSMSQNASQEKPDT